jgi:short-subunit dehydrogenase
VPADGDALPIGDAQFHGLVDGGLGGRDNLFDEGVVHGLRTFVPIMLEQGQEGHVVNTASMAGLLSGPTADIYGATKHAVVRITEALYHQLKLDESQVSASVLCPGIIKTRIYSSGRNRPGALFEGDHPTGSDLQEQAAEADTYWGNDGLSPDEVADQVLQSIRDDQLYILTRDVPRDRIMERTENIVNGRNPKVVQPRPIRP